MYCNPRVAECVQHMLCWYLKCWPCSTLIQFNIKTMTLKIRIANINITRLKSAASGWSSRDWKRFKQYMAIMSCILLNIFNMQHSVWYDWRPRLSVNHIFSSIVIIDCLYCFPAIGFTYIHISCITTHRRSALWQLTNDKGRLSNR